MENRKSPKTTDDYDDDNIPEIDLPQDSAKDSADSTAAYRFFRKDETAQDSLKDNQKYTAK